MDYGKVNSILKIIYRTEQYLSFLGEMIEQYASDSQAVILAPDTGYSKNELRA